ncbi:uncharacterized protein [Montipora capricornis]|uniref:uncharacterized protein n=1 Tax=Montipora capricornis TaxID=246305 RepID=UPI0035F1F22C
MHAQRMLAVLVIALLVGFANSRSNDEATGIWNKDKTKYCGCTGKEQRQCGCCVNLQEIIKQNYAVCTNLTYIESETGVRLTFTANNKVLFNETLSGENPPPLCEGMIGMADLCVKVSNMSYEKKKFGGCIEIYSDVVRRVVDLKLGCHYYKEKGFLVTDTEESIETEIGLRYLFEMGNSVRERILDEMYKWSFFQNGDHNAMQDLNQDGLPEEPGMNEYDEEQFIDSS